MWGVALDGLPHKKTRVKKGKVIIVSIETMCKEMYPDGILGKIFEYNNVDEIREWFKNEYGESPSIILYKYNSINKIREHILNSDDVKVQYIKLKEKIVSKGLEYRTSFPVSGKYKIEQKERTLEDDEELEMFHFRLYDDYGKLFGVILLCAEEISEKQQRKIDAAEEAGIRVGGEELINELETHNMEV